MKSLFNRLLLVFLVLLVTSCGGLKIIDKPITFNEDRTKLTLEYLETRYGLQRPTAEITPKMIVLHWTEIPSFEKSFAAFKGPRLPGSRSDITSAGSLNVSSHFLVDQDGTVYQLMPDNIMARHVIGLNHCAIGIENVGGTKDMPLTQKQVRANNKLIRYLKEKYPIEYVIGHYEYTLFEGHELWLEKDAGYRTKKVDPGTDFMAKVRKATKKLKFKPIPSQK